MIRIKNNQLAMFHILDLTEEEIEYIVTKFNAVKFLNDRERFFNNCYNKSDLEQFSFVKREFEILKSLKSKLDVFDKSEV